MWLLGNRRRLEAVEKEVAELRELVRELRDLPADWEDWLHKIRNVLARLNQRARAEEEVERLGPTPPGRRSVNPMAARLLNGTFPEE